MVEERYCSYEVAKLLKEKGFPQDYDLFHSMVYNEEDYEDEYEVQRMITQTKLIKAGTLSSYPAGVPGSKCFCPTHQMACDWLGDIYDLHIIAYPYKRGNSKGWCCYVYKTYNLLGQEKYVNETCNSCYEAIEAALKYALKNLI